MIWIIAIVIIGFILFRFWSDFNKNKVDLQGKLANKFEHVVQEIYTAAFGGKGDIQLNNQRQFNLINILQIKYSSCNMVQEY